jgi:hypothetical protein
MSHCQPDATPNMRGTANTGEFAQRIWDQILRSVFSDDMVIRIAADKLAHLEQGDSTYNDLRNTATARTVETINYLIDTPGLTWADWQDHVRSLPPLQQGFLLDRFNFVKKYLAKMKSHEFFPVGEVNEFLRWGLIQMWDARSRETE